MMVTGVASGGFVRPEDGAHDKTDPESTATAAKANIATQLELRRREDALRLWMDFAPRLLMVRNFTPSHLYCATAMCTARDANNPMRRRRRFRQHHRAILAPCSRNALPYGLGGNLGQMCGIVISVTDRLTEPS